MVIERIPLTLAICLNRPLLLVSLLDGTQSLLRVEECKFLPTLVCPGVGARIRTLLIGLSLLLQQCPEYSVCLIWMVCEIED